MSAKLWCTWILLEIQNFCHLRMMKAYKYGVFLVQEPCLKKSSAAKWQFLELKITKSEYIHATGLTTEFNRL